MGHISIILPVKKNIKIEMTMARARGVSKL